MPLMLEQLELRQFKGFNEFTLDCTPITCLVGLNSQGKTTILQAIALVHDIINRAFGGGTTPQLANPGWKANPSADLNRITLGDADAIWWQKKTSVPCRIRCSYTGDIEVHLNIIAANSYDLDIRQGGSSLRTPDEETRSREVVSALFALKPTFVPPVGTISPEERKYNYPEVERMLAQGRNSECWRSRLFWLWNDGNKDAFERLSARIQRYLPGSRMVEPRLTHGNPEGVLIEFQEDDVRFDIGTSGAGLRSILNLAAVLEFADSRCLLCDEPDSHLHPSLQAAVGRMLRDHASEKDCQLFMATHAADLIAEVPNDSIVWIDRTQSTGKRCNDVGTVLADLGAVTKADAIRAHGASGVLLVEGTLDRQVLRQLLSGQEGRNVFADPHVLVGTLPNGRGDAAHISVFCDFLRTLFKLNVKIACLTDNDYDFNNEAPTEAAGHTMVIRLDRKEIENYLIEPRTVTRALEGAVCARQARGKTEDAPKVDVATVTARVNGILAGFEKAVRCQLVPRYRDTLKKSLDASDRETRADEWFEERWSDDRWRFRMCPGKLVLRQLRATCKDEFSVTLTTRQLLGAIGECPPELGDIGRRLQLFFFGKGSER